MILPRSFLPVLFAIAVPLALGAADSPPAGGEAKKPEPARAAESDAPKLSVTQHSVVIGGKALKYTATCGYLVLKGEPDKAQAHGGEKPPEAAPSKDGLKAKAKIFFTAYTLDGADPATRPIAYAFNGGPGAASVWLHLGGLGPRKVVLDASGAGTPAPYHLVDNEWSSLAQTDLVFIDPVSTGYSRPAAGEDARSFHGFDEDLHSVAEFIRLYTTENGRWFSPKLLIGESYGGTRAAALAGLLQERHDLYVNGIVIVSGVLNWQGIDYRDPNALAFVFAVPSYAATAWYHHRLSPELQAKSVAEVYAQAEQFTEREFLPALIKGNALTAPERQSVAGRLSGFTGIPVEILLRYHLRLPAGNFTDELLKSDRQSVGRFDSRLTGPADVADGADYDPSFTTMRGNFTASIHEYLRTELKFETELPYQSLANVSPWSFANAENRYLDVSEPLAKAMARNRHLKVWLVTGCYDLAVPYAATQYAVRQMYLDPSVEGNIEISTLESGHMFYTQDGPLKQFAGQFERFVSRCTH